MDDPRVVESLGQSRKMLQKAEMLSQKFAAPAYPILRIDDDVSEGISRTAREQNASLILMGWSRQGFRARLFGTLIDDVFLVIPLPGGQLLDCRPNRWISIAFWYP